MAAMKIPAWLFFSFWALISFTFLHLGFHALDKTKLSNVSVPPVVMSFFKYFLAIFSCCSVQCALLCRPQYGYDVDSHYYLLLYCGTYVVFIQKSIFPEKFETTLFVLKAWAFLSCLLPRFFIPDIYYGKRSFCLLLTYLCFQISCFPRGCLPVFILIKFILVVSDYSLIPELKTRISVHTAMEASLFFVSGESSKRKRFNPSMALFVSYFISMVWIILSMFGPRIRVPRNRERLGELLHVAATNRNIRSLIEFVVGTAFAVLFHYFFRLTSFNEVVAFFYLAVMWVANLTLLGVSNDFGVLTFILGNVVLGSTASEFRLFWLVASVLLFGLRRKLQSLTLLYGEGEHIQFTFW